MELEVLSIHGVLADGTVLSRVMDPSRVVPTLREVEGGCFRAACHIRRPPLVKGHIFP